MLNEVTEFTFKVTELGAQRIISIVVFITTYLIVVWFGLAQTVQCLQSVIHNNTEAELLGAHIKQAQMLKRAMIQLTQKKQFKC